MNYSNLSTEFEEFSLTTQDSTQNEDPWYKVLYEYGNGYGGGSGNGGGYGSGSNGFLTEGGLRTIGGMGIPNGEGSGLGERLVDWIWGGDFT
jgi:hypothetical protein